MLNRRWFDVDVEDIAEYEQGLYSFLDSDPDGIAVMRTVRETGKLEDADADLLLKVIKAFTDRFLQAKKA